MSKLDVPEETLNEVFLTRSKIGKYFSIPEDKREIMLKYFQKNPYPKKEELVFLSQYTGIEKNKIQNWFKYQRQKDFKTNKTIIKSYKSNRKFSREGKKILELYFRKNHELTENALKKISVVLKCDKSQVERWFYYRNKKLSTLINKKDKSSIDEENDNNSAIDESSKNILDSMPKQDLETKKPIAQPDLINPFTFPNFKLPPPPPIPSYLQNLGKFPHPYNQLWPNISLINGFLLKRNEFFQNTLNDMFGALAKSNTEKNDIKKEHIERTIEKGVEVKKEEVEIKIKKEIE